MLVAFCEQANGQTFPENATDQELLELVMGRCVFLLLIDNCNHAPKLCPEVLFVGSSTYKQKQYIGFFIRIHNIHFII